MKLLAPVLTTVAVVALTSTARAALDEPIAGARSFAMGGASRAVPTSNDALFVNPAGMAAVKRYGVELQYGYTSRDGTNHLSLSAVDSKSGPVAGGMAFSHVGGGVFSGGLNQFYLGVGYSISDSIAFGTSLHYLRGGYSIFGDTAQDVSLYTGDVGVMVTLVEGFTLGFAYNNVVSTSRPMLTPPTLGWGASFSTGAFTLAGDMSTTVGTAEERQWGTSYHAGVEYYFGEVIPVRLGYTRQRINADGGFPYESYLSGGLGYALQGGALELSYRHRLERGDDWGIVGALKFYL
jgi:hypothetical protein